MVTREILSLIPIGTIIRVEQVAIRQLGGGENVQRHFDNVEDALSSNQNYLDYKAVCLKQVGGIITVVCQASQEQELATIRAWYEGR